MPLPSAKHALYYSCALMTSLCCSAPAGGTGFNRSVKLCKTTTVMMIAFVVSKFVVITLDKQGKCLFPFANHVLYYSSCALMTSLCCSTSLLVLLGSTEVDRESTGNPEGYHQSHFHMSGTDWIPGKFWNHDRYQAIWQQHSLWALGHCTPLAHWGS